MVTEVNNAVTKWSNVITGMPGTDGATRTLPVNISFQELTGSIFASTNVFETSDEGFTNNLFKVYATKSSVRVNSNQYATHWNNELDPVEANDNTTSHALEDIIKREFGKSLGIGGQFWVRNINPDDNLHENDLWENKGSVFTNEFNGIDAVIGGNQVGPITDNKHYLLYIGTSALNVYNTVTSVSGQLPTFNNEQTVTNYRFDLTSINNIYDAIIANTGLTLTGPDPFLGIPVVSAEMCHCHLRERMQIRCQQINLL